MVFLLGMAAFAVDVGYAVYVKSQLQNAADAAALAGAAELMQPYVPYSLPLQSAGQKAQILQSAMANAQNRAVALAALNSAGDVASLAVGEDDIVCGFLDKHQQFWPTPPDSRFPNSVQVTARRDQQRNSPLPLFLASLFGKPTLDLAATARATAVSEVTTFSPHAGVNGKLLPIALDVRVWNQFVQNYTSPASENYVTTGPNGAPQLHIYPFSSPEGGFGLVSIGPPSNSTPSYRAWIDSGPTPADLQYLQTANLLPVASNNPKYWNAASGLHSTLQSNLAGVIGQPRLLPLYDETLGGSGKGYPIVGFAGITVSEASGHGSANMNISVQPVMTVDPTALGGSPMGSAPPTFSFRTPQLTQ
jgi:Flp pilus assembly protein TadG